MSHYISFDEMSVENIKSFKAKTFIREKHYSKSCHNGPSPCYGLFVGDILVGVLCFATPCSENVRSSLFGREHKNRVIELHRLFVEDSINGRLFPTGTESWFISRCIKRLKNDRSDLWGIITFADSTEGHNGVIYRATNAIYCGMTGKSTFYRDGCGRLRHPRQNGINISLSDAESLGWTPEKRHAKHRFVYLLYKNKPDKRRLEGLFLYNKEQK